MENMEKREKDNMALERILMEAEAGKESSPRFMKYLCDYGSRRHAPLIDDDTAEMFS